MSLHRALRLGHRKSATRVRTDQVLDEVLRPALDGLGFEVFHADQIMAPGPISRQVLELVGIAELVVADLTEANRNVVYELAMRHCTGKPTIQLVGDLADLPFHVAGERTILLDLSSAAAIRGTIREIRAFAQYLLAHPAAFVNPITQLFRTTFVPREATILGASLGHVVSEHAEARPVWQFLQSDAAEESLLRIANDLVIHDVAMQLLRKVQSDPLGGMPLAVHDRPIYCVSVRMPETATLPALHLVYALDELHHAIAPLRFFGGGEGDNSAESGMPDAGALGGSAFTHHRTWH